MKQLTIQELKLWQFQHLAAEAQINHFVTDRNTNLNGEAFTLSYSSLPDKEVIRQNRALLAAAMGVAEQRLYLPSQVHSTRIVRVENSTQKETLLETDALISNEKGLCIAVMSADCVPILLYDAKNKAVGAVHAGWRGTVAKILERTLQAMQLNFGTRGEDLLAGIGPSVSQESYEVGGEVIEAVAQAFGVENDLLLPQPGNKAKLDLWKANSRQLLDFGVAPARIEVANLCTVKNNQHFFSARKGDSGRFAAGIMLR